MDRAMREKLESLEQAIKDRSRTASEKPKTAEIVQLPLWPEPARGVPNSVLRGALFAAIQGKDRPEVEREP